MNLKRISTVLKKDLKENYIVIFIVILIPIFAYYLPQLNFEPKAKLAVVAEDRFDLSGLKENFKIISVDSPQRAERLLEEGEVDGIVDTYNKSVRTYNKDMKFLTSLKAVLAKDNSAELNIINGESGMHSYNSLLSVILLVMICIIGCPIVYLSEYTDGIFSYMTITPITYRELLTAKILFGFIASMASLLLFLLGICSYSVNVTYFITIIAVISVFISVLSGVVSLIFDSLESYLLVMSPVSILIIFGLIFIYSKGDIAAFPLYSVFYALTMHNQLDIVNLAILAVGSVTLGAVYLAGFKLLRRNYA